MIHTVVMFHADPKQLGGQSLSTKQYDHVEDLEVRGDWLHWYAVGVGCYERIPADVVAVEIHYDTKREELEP